MANLGYRGLYKNTQPMTTNLTDKMDQNMDMVPYSQRFGQAQPQGADPLSPQGQFDIAPMSTTGMEDLAIADLMKQSVGAQQNLGKLYGLGTVDFGGKNLQKSLSGINQDINFDPGKGKSFDEIKGNFERYFQAANELIRRRGGDPTKPGFSMAEQGRDLTPAPMRMSMKYKGPSGIPTGDFGENISTLGDYDRMREIYNRAYQAYAPTFGLQGRFTY